MCWVNELSERQNAKAEEIRINPLLLIKHTLQTHLNLIESRDLNII